jgi:alkanesulfonate monooxygenase SsuD/methylene tetrahydromethanopterin reductase-like flavin-dependent oxidoreductase (luciferase family)
MQISHGILWQNWGRERGAREFVQDELYLAELAEDLGYDAITTPEHHFDPEYSACPDNFIPLAFLAARTKTIRLVLSAVILPWNDPLRVIEKISMLDHVSNGRLTVGFGRGLAKQEYEGFGFDMSESRERFDEAAEIILRGLRTGVAEADGKYYKQPRVEVHPKPRPELVDEVWSVAMSPDSSLVAADLGMSLACFTTAIDELMLPLIDGYRTRFREVNGREAAPELINDFMVCHADADEARCRAQLYAGRYYEEVVRHYDMGGKHFQKTKGYEAYAEGAKAIEAAGMDASKAAYVDAQVSIGTPDQIIKRFQHRHDVLGRTGITVAAFYGGMPREIAVEHMTLFAKEVIPELRRIDSE